MGWVFRLGPKWVWAWVEFSLGRLGGLVLGSYTQNLKPPPTHISTLHTHTLVGQMDQGP